MRSKPSPNYLAGYPAALTEQVQRLIEQDRLAGMLRQKYPFAHDVRTDKALYDYVLEIKGTYLRNTGQLSKVVFDNKLHIIKNALGTHTSIYGCKERISKRSVRFAWHRCSRKCHLSFCA